MMTLWRGLLRLPFENVIPPGKRDKNLRNTLTDLKITGPAVLTWAVDGCAKWYTRGLQIPVSVQLATDAYKKDHICSLISFQRRASCTPHGSPCSSARARSIDLKYRVACNPSSTFE